MKTVWSEKGLKEKNSRLAFRIKCKSADKIELIALDFYNIYVDGKFLGYGPARTSYGYARRDVYDLTGYTDFYLTVEVCCHNIKSYSFASMNPLFGAEIYLDEKIVADTLDFECFNLDHAVQKVQKYSFQRGFSENYILKRDPALFRTGKIDYTRLDMVEVKCPIILDRVADYPDYTYLGGMVIESGVFEVNKNREHWVENVQMTNDPNMNEAYERSEIGEFVSDTVSEFEYRATGCVDYNLSKKQFLTYDFSRIVTGIFDIKVKVTEDAELYLSWSEHVQKVGHTLDMDFSRNTCCDIIKWKLKKGEYRLNSFEPYCGKYARLNLLSGRVEILSFGVKLVENPNIKKVKFTCENKNLEKIVGAAINTLAQNALDVPSDCPGRERAGWLCDSYFIGQAENYLFGNSKVEKAFLENYTLLNDEMRDGYPEGMIPMTFPSNIASRKFIPNWSLWYVHELKEYYDATGDRELIEKSKPNVLGILAYFAKSENSDGLLEDLKSWVFVEWSMANHFTTGINYPTNMLYSSALKVAGELYGIEEYVQKAEKMTSAIIEQSFNGEFFEDNALRDEKGNLKRTGNTTETCQYYAMLFGFADGDKFSKFRTKMIEQFGRKRDVEKVYPTVHKSNAFIGNFIRLMYLLRVGEYKKVLIDCEDYFTYMAEQTDTLWEYDTVKNSMNHGFASYSAKLIIESLKHTGLYKYEFNIEK